MEFSGSILKGASFQNVIFAGVVYFCNATFDSSTNFTGAEYIYNIGSYDTIHLHDTGLDKVQLQSFINWAKKDLRDFDLGGNPDLNNLDLRGFRLDRSYVDRLMGLDLRGASGTISALPDSYISADGGLFGLDWYENRGDFRVRSDPSISTVYIGDASAKVIYDTNLILESGITLDISRNNTFKSDFEVAGILTFGDGAQITGNNTLVFDWAEIVVDFEGNGTSGVVLIDVDLVTGLDTLYSLTVYENGVDTTYSGDWTLSYDGTGKVSLIGSPVPEPATVAMLAGLLMFGFAACFRRK
jgi:hypothetical protein